jgi:hypothetical protein
MEWCNMGVQLWDCIRRGKSRLTPALTRLITDRLYERGEFSLRSRSPRRTPTAARPRSAFASRQLGLALTSPLRRPGWDTFSRHVDNPVKRERGGSGARRKNGPLGVFLHHFVCNLRCCTGARTSGSGGETKAQSCDIA